MFTETKAHQFELTLPPATDAALKERRRLAFTAWQEAIKAGDAELAAAAEQRFLEASLPFATWRRLRL